MDLLGLGSVIGGGLGLVGNIAGRIGASKAARRAKKYVEDQRSENDAWYARRYNEDATQRGDAQAAIEHTRRALAERARNAAGAAAVTGASAEAEARAKADGNSALANTMSGIAAAGASSKDAIDAQHRQADEALTQQMVGIETGRAQQMTEGASALGQSVVQLGGAVDNYLAATAPSKPKAAD